MTATPPPRPYGTPPVLSHDDRLRIGRAAAAVRRLHPDPIGEFIAAELQRCLYKGCAVGPDGQTWALVATIETQLALRQETPP